MKNEKFNDQQTQWRKNIIKYLSGNSEFRRDFAEGKISYQTLGSWGVKGVVGPVDKLTPNTMIDVPRIRFELVEEY